jgi:glycosyltransferase involved in cell wall biosynthesis
MDLPFILEYIQRHQIKIIWFGYGNISTSLIKALSAANQEQGLGLKLIVDTDSVWSRFVLRKAPFARSWFSRQLIRFQGRLKEIEEKEFVNLADCVTAVSDVDAEFYRSLSDSTQKVMRFSNVIDLALYERPAKEPTRDKPFVFFAGYFGPDSPTDQAARWIIKDIMPLVWKSAPELEFVIAGKGSRYTLSDIRHPQVVIEGEVETVVPYLYQAVAALVPLKFESGTRFKILEAGACRAAIVSTTLGAEGIQVVDGESIEIADTPSQFAAAILKLYHQPSHRRQLGQRMHALVEREFSLTQLEREGTAILNGVSGG